MSQHYGPDFPKITYTSHAYQEYSVDLGEIVMNYAVTGPESAPALLMIPGLVESWWAYEIVMKLIETDFRIYAVDIRGQGRSTRTPSRYTLDNWGNDLARFMERVIGRPALVAGSSVGGVMGAWLAAYGPKGLVRGVYMEDSPLFASELIPACGPGIRQSAVGHLFSLFSKYLGDQWSVGEWSTMLAQAHRELPAWMLPWLPVGDEPPQNLKEFDPEGARAFLSGSATAACCHKQMLKAIKTPVLYTHHFRGSDPETGIAQGAASDFQVRYAQSIVEQAGQTFEYRSLPKKGHALHLEDGPLYASILKDWALRQT
ncbi:alpha/beta fold hydrolase [Labrys okinawensis]|uniref:alpha/beta fold hydrolase n=1 Tax=Labrys okinawensis TaxID=346911 RepID=UPI0039BD0F42